MSAKTTTNSVPNERFDGSGALSTSDRQRLARCALYARRSPGRSGIDVGEELLALHEHCAGAAVDGARTDHASRQRKRLQCIEQGAHGHEPPALRLPACEQLREDWRETHAFEL